MLASSGAEEVTRVTSVPDPEAEGGARTVRVRFSAEGWVELFDAVTGRTYSAGRASFGGAGEPEFQDILPTDYDARGVFVG